MVEPLIIFRCRRRIASIGMLALGLCVVAALVARFFLPLSPWMFVALGSYSRRPELGSIVARSVTTSPKQTCRISLPKFAATVENDFDETTSTI
jgi:hypothetical protein